MNNIVLVSVFILLILILQIIFFVIISKRINDINKDIDNLNGDLTSTQTHIRCALSGSYFMLKELEKKFNFHSHSYKFDNGVLYIQEPIINESSEDLEDSDYTIFDN